MSGNLDFEWPVIHSQNLARSGFVVLARRPFCWHKEKRLLFFFLKGRDRRVHGLLVAAKALALSAGKAGNGWHLHHGTRGGMNGSASWLEPLPSHLERLAVAGTFTTVPGAERIALRRG